MLQQQGKFMSWWSSIPLCFDTTARQAVHRGFTVEFLSDATGTLPLDNAAG
jgi:hypothetical protein